jgi:hypothetical protein
MYKIILACPVKLTLSEISHVYMQSQARYSVLCTITSEDGPFGPKHVVDH